MAKRTVETKFWTITQNNSGGYFDHNPEKGIGYALSVEALDKADAEGRLARIIDSYGQSGSCPCCGDRWSVFLWKEDGANEPELYGKPLRGGWGIPSYSHYLDGKIVAHAETDA